MELSVETLSQAIPLDWIRSIAYPPILCPWHPRVIFVGDMSDLFCVYVFDWLLREVIEPIRSPAGLRHWWYLVTKRPGAAVSLWHWLRTEAGTVWPGNLGVIASVTSQRTAEERMPDLVGLAELGVHCEVSLEPLLEAVDLVPWLWDGPRRGSFPTTRGLIRRVIVGGESGPGARPCDLDWVRSVRDQCGAVGVPLLVKQLGAKSVRMVGPMDYAQTPPAPSVCETGWTKHPKAADPAEWPEDLRIRQPVELPRWCRRCGCTDQNCLGCIEQTGRPCHWVEPDLCSACAKKS